MSKSLSESQARNNVVSKRGQGPGNGDSKTYKTAKGAKDFNFLSGGGEMGERIRNFDWGKTS